MALLLSDEFDRIPDLVGAPPVPETLSPRERQTYLVFRRRQARSMWAALDYPQFYIEELLDEFDNEDLYREARFLRPVPRRERGMANYEERLDRAILRSAKRAEQARTFQRPSIVNVDPQFWGEQGRVARIQAGPHRGGFIFIYPDTAEPWWTIVIDPSPVEGAPGDLYIDDTGELDYMVKDWDLFWVPRDEDDEIEREHFGWRPLRGPGPWITAD
ncbi:hypothetical protein [Diaminobutyricimonas sp. LJ205]|uniref:hypothetical protein n=1 Tax=Diaminobutyricimonas sp. LJ205 TaxID=2683590 RepID=UPI0012F513A5|nr:hypothetical protein [Diaminobutyricimonas sp. LJ205]